MSNYFCQAINPRTGKEETAEMLDDYYGRHRYGVRFRDGFVYRDDDRRLWWAAKLPKEGDDK